MTRERFTKFCWAALAFVVAVILWGAVVRATGSGAGCGSHWPTCNGDVVPKAPGEHTIIEYVHRLTSGLSALVVLAQLIWARKLYEPGDRVRWAVGWASALMLVEVAIGAGLVVLKYVADDQRLARAWWTAGHLCNTMLLVGAMTLAAHYAGGGARATWREHGRSGRLVLLTSILLLGVGASGAVAALGDTLFKSPSLAAGIAADFSPSAHALLKLRAVHPFLALIGAAMVFMTRSSLAARFRGPGVERFGTMVMAAVGVQLLFGFANLALLAPTWMQIVHLLLAQLVWMALLLFAEAALAGEPIEI